MTHINMVFLCLILGLLTQPRVAAAQQSLTEAQPRAEISPPGRAPSSTAFRDSMTSYSQNLQEQSVGFLVGGTLGLGLSLALATRESETLSKTGLAIVAATSTLGIMQGVDLAFRGDALTREAQTLEHLDRALRRAGVPTDRRERILDRYLLDRLVALREQRDDTSRWKGLVSLGAAAGGALALSAARDRSTGSQVGLALFTLTAAVYGVASLLPGGGAKGIAELQANVRLEMFPYGPAAGFVALLP